MVQNTHPRVPWLALLVALWALPGGRALADTFQVTKTLDTRDGKCDADCSLREAIIAANQHPGADTVMLPAGKYVLQQVGQEDQAAAGDLDILDDLTLIGTGVESTLIDGNQIDRVFNIHSPAVVRLSGLTIQNGSASIGGGIYNAGTLTLESCMLSGNSASTGGGGVYNDGTLTLESCTMSGNSADSHGGGGIANFGTATLTNCTVSGNSTNGDGGGIYNGGMATLTNCTLSRNLANHAGDGGIYGGGGGIYNSGTATLRDCTLSGNSDKMHGHGGIVNQTGGTLTLENCTLSGNGNVSVLYGGGGGLYNRGTATLMNCTLSDNTSRGDGGGIYNFGTATLTDCTLSGNWVSAYGGGIYNGGTLTLTNCTLSGNTAAAGSGGGIDNQYSSMATLTNTTLSGNSASRGDGGAIDNGGTLTLENCTLSDNSADSHGGGIINSGTLTLTSCGLTGNSANRNGGGIYNGYSSTATLTLESCTLSGNLANYGYGGGIYHGYSVRTTVTNSTLSDNSASIGGGIYMYNETSSGATLRNTIIANSPRGGNCSRSTLLQSNGHNLDDDGGCGFFSTGDLSLVRANLAPLGNYGGPTQTHALCTGPGVPHPDCQAASPAIDAADDAYCPTTDQRGAPRPYGSACDIGAYEAQPNFIPTPSVAPTNTATDMVTATPTTPTGSQTSTPRRTATHTPTRRPTATFPATPTPYQRNGGNCTGGLQCLSGICANNGPGTVGTCCDRPCDYNPGCEPCCVFSGWVGTCIDLSVGTPTPRRSPTATASPTRTLTTTPSATPDLCVGDCGRGGSVTIDEILTMVNIALGNADMALCVAGDGNGDGMITVDEILTSVNAALNGCRPLPTPIRIRHAMSRGLFWRRSRSPG